MGESKKEGGGRTKNSKINNWGGGGAFFGTGVVCL